ncbi:hypothetical protein Leryth_024512 [Lithospermum erythrorhizon]|nr:hypothetical protein Leryth_024512 [Lithospermum erythrorhizon]
MPRDHSNYPKEEIIPAVDLVGKRIKNTRTQRNAAAGKESIRRDPPNLAPQVHHQNHRVVMIKTKNQEARSHGLREGRKRKVTSQDHDQDQNTLAVITETMMVLCPFQGSLVTPKADFLMNKLRIVLFIRYHLYLTTVLSRLLVLIVSECWPHCYRFQYTATCFSGLLFRMNICWCECYGS